MAWWGLSSRARGKPGASRISMATRLARSAPGSRSGGVIREARRHLVGIPRPAAAKSPEIAAPGDPDAQAHAINRRLRQGEHVHPLHPLLTRIAETLLYDHPRGHAADLHAHVGVQQRRLTAALPIDGAQPQAGTTHLVPHRLRNRFIEGCPPARAGQERSRINAPRASAPATPLDGAPRAGTLLLAAHSRRDGS